MTAVTMTVNGKTVSADIEDRTLLVYFLRHPERGAETDVRLSYGVSIWSFVDGLFDTPKQGPQRGADDLRLFKPGKVNKSLQDLAVGRSQPDRCLFQV